MKINDLKFGDIICVKSFSFIGWAIGKSFHVNSPMTWYIGTESQRKRPSNHNGVVGYGENGELVVFEALAKGIVQTPIQRYLDEVSKKKCEIKFLRANIYFDDKTIEFGQHWLNKQIGVKYDFLSFVSHIWRNTLNLPGIKIIQRENRFYCTEFVMKFYQFIRPWAGCKTDFFNKKLPTPYTVEKRWKEGILTIVKEVF